MHHLLSDSPALQFVGKWVYKAYDKRALILMYAHLLVSAVFPIYIGSHASLKRPPSATLPQGRSIGADTDFDDDELEEKLSEVQGLSPADAILFPISASITLGGLYLIIKWLNDPKILNQILNWYFSVIGVFGVAKLAADGLNVATTFVFPKVWATTEQTYFIDHVLSSQLTGLPLKDGGPVTRKLVENKTNPFPGTLSSIQFSDSNTKRLWSLRALLKNHWKLRVYVHNVVNSTISLKLNDAAGLALGIIAVVLYNIFERPWWLTNVLAIGFCHATLQFMSPTTFWTGTLVLSGLFLYDIAMVFYTPLMITVATSLDVPIKLVFPGPRAGSMLGLGDVALPGMMIALALRFDLYLHYLNKQKFNPLSPGGQATQACVKATYVDATGVWGERFWTSTSREQTSGDGGRFKKLYFCASVVGYVFGMIVTLVVLKIFDHAQPALLYLVPSVLGALWGTAFVRDEIGLMWEYTEDGKWGFEVAKAASEENGEQKNNVHDGAQTAKESNESSIDREKKTKRDSEKLALYEHRVFSFSLTAPRVKRRSETPSFK